MKELQRLLNANGQVLRWPSKPKEKTLVIEYLASKFSFDQDYSEQDVNQVLQAWHTFSDLAMLRRELFERGFLDRNKQGSSYQKTQKPFAVFTETQEPLQKSQRIRLEHIQEASQNIDPVFLNSPQFYAESLSDVLGCELIVKVETMNPIRSFKGRGADYFFVRNPKIKEVVCASAGNFGQGVAYAARKRNIKATVFAAETANVLKIERMKSFGADVRLHGQDFDAAKCYAKDYARQNKLRFIEDSRDTAFTEGAGSMAVELLNYPKPFDTVVVPLGNGAMITGIARWVKAKSPNTKVVGVSAAGAPAMEKSWRAGTYIQTDSINTIADGIGVRVPVAEALEDLKGLIDDVVLVEDSTTIAAMKLAHQHLGVVLEPSGAVGIAALINTNLFSGQRIATVLCGGNITPEQMKTWL